MLLIILTYRSIQSYNTDITMTQEGKQLQKQQFQDYDMMALNKEFQTAQQRQFLQYCPQQTPISENLFEQLIMRSDGQMMLDKSLFIKQVIEEKAQILMFNRPSKWGKTTMLTMIKTFLTKQKNTRQVQKNVKMFFNLKIYKQERQFFNSHNQKYLVIHLDLNITTFESVVSIKKQILMKIANVYRQNRIKQGLQILQHALSLPNSQFQDFLTKNSFKDELDKLASLLEKQNKMQQTFILIDNIYSCISCMIYDNFTTKQVKQVAQFISNQLFQFSFNNDKRKAIIMSKIDCYTKWNALGVKFKRYQLRDLQYSSYFGVTQEQLTEIIKTRYTELNAKNLWKNITCWYGGYQIFNKNSKRVEDLYVRLFQPHLVLKYLKQVDKFLKVVDPLIYQMEQPLQNKLIKFLFASSSYELSKIIELITLVSGNGQGRTNGNSSIQIDYKKDTDGLLLQELTDHNVQEKQTNFKKYVAYLLQSEGYIASMFYQFSKTLSIYVPNINTLYFFKKKIQTHLQRTKKITDFSFINLANQKQSGQKFLKAVQEWTQDINLLNQATITSIMYTRYILSNYPTHSMYMEQSIYNGQKIKGRFDLACISLGLDQNYLLIENKFTKVYKDMPVQELKKIQILSFVQIYTKGYLEWLVKKLEKQKVQIRSKIKNFILRVIIFQSDNKQIKQTSNQHVYTIKQGKSIVEFFGQRQIKKIISAHKKNFSQMLDKILKLTKTEDLDTLLNQTKILQIPEVERYICKKNKSQVKYNVQNYNFQKLRQKVPLIEKLYIKDMGDIFNLSVVQLMSNVRKGESIKKKQAQVIRQELKLYQYDEEMFIGPALRKRVKKQSK